MEIEAETDWRYLVKSILGRYNEIIASRAM